MTLQEKIGQFFFPAVFINDTEENIQEMEQLIKAQHIGGLTFFHSRASAATNYESKKKIVINDASYLRLKELIARYQKSASIPLLISIDAEWGLAMRVEKTPQYPYAITLGALPENKAALVYTVGKHIASDLLSAGIHYNLAPLADINNNPNNPVIGYRSFGESKEKIAHFALEYARGMNDAGVLSCLKHFPGHGNTSIDSHLDLPVLNETLDELLENELYPFIEGIKNNIDSIMIGHLAVSALNDGKNTSATLSKNVIEGLLRKRLGYEGLVISDALNMHSVSKLYPVKGQLEWEAFNAGNDVLCFAENVAEGIEAILKNATPERIDASFNRLMACKEKVGLLKNHQAIGKLDFDAAVQLNTELAKYSLTIIKDNDNSKAVQEASINNKLACISLYKPANCSFSNTLSSHLNLTNYSLNDENIQETENIFEALSQYETIIIALFLPKAKPANNFDIHPEILALLSKILLEKKSILYSFGNPYALQHIPNLDAASGIVQVYQNFEEFQKNAADQLLNNSLTYGTLPVAVSFL